IFWFGYYSRCRGRSSPENTIFAGFPAPEVQLTYRRDLRKVQLARTNCVEVRRIHHRAIHSFRATKGDSAEFSAEV
ncbi:hypothetical protein Prudu_013761, partial [Prunus dulcis]